MKQVVFFLFGEQYGNYLLETNIAYYMLAGLLAIIVVVLLILVILMLKGMKLEKAGASDEDFPEEFQDERLPVGIPQQPAPGPAQPETVPVRPAQQPGQRPPVQQQQSAPIEVSKLQQSPQRPPMQQQSAPIEASKLQQSPKRPPMAQQPAPIQASTFQQMSQRPQQGQQSAPRPFMKEGFLPPVDDKPGMIPNPLPVPPQKIRRENDYDIEVPDNDDYDIK